MEFDTKWEHLQCAGVIFSMAPWSANYMLYWAKSDAAHAFQIVTGRGAENDKALNIIWYGTLFAFFCLNGLFTITNILPAILAYFWVAVPVDQMVQALAGR